MFKEPVVDATLMERNKDLYVFEHPKYTERNCRYKECEEMPEIVDMSYETFVTVSGSISEMIGKCPLVICYKLRWKE